MILQIIDKNRSPRGEYRYKVPETGAELHHPHWPPLVNSVYAHYEGNNLTPPVGLPDLIEAYNCETNPEICEERRTIPAMMISFAEALKRFAGSGFKTVPEDVLEFRSAQCKSCPYFSHFRYESSNEENPGVARCNKCGCSSLKLYLPKERCPLEEPRWTQYES